jgi:nucleoside-diphosphate-sugar epimerase
VRIFVTGGSGVLGRAVLPLLSNHDVVAPGSQDLDVYDAEAVRVAVVGADAVVHLATRIPAPDRSDDPAAWAENDRLRSVATGVLVDAAVEAGTLTFVLPTITFVYPPGAADENTPVGDVAPRLRSALAAEHHVRRFTAAGRRGVVLRLGLLYGPGTHNAAPNPVFGSSLHTADAARALVLALFAPAGIGNVCDDGSGVSNAAYTRATGWRPSAR